MPARPGGGAHAQLLLALPLTGARSYGDCPTNTTLTNATVSPSGLTGPPGPSNSCACGVLITTTACSWGANASTISVWQSLPAVQLVYTNNQYSQYANIWSMLGAGNTYSQVLAPQRELFFGVSWSPPYVGCNGPVNASWSSAWQHYAYVLGPVNQLYQNGVLVWTEPTGYAWTPPPVGTTLQVGGDEYSSLLDFRVYGAALNASQVAALFAEGPNGAPPPTLTPSVTPSPSATPSGTPSVPTPPPYTITTVVGSGVQGLLTGNVHTHTTATTTTDWVMKHHPTWHAGGYFYGYSLNHHYTTTTNQNHHDHDKVWTPASGCFETWSTHTNTALHNSINLFHHFYACRHEHQLSTTTYTTTDLNGPALTVALSHAYGLVVTPVGGYVYIANSGENVVNFFNPDIGYVTNFVGTGNAGSSGDGGYSLDAELDAPCGVALDSSGNLYVTEFGGARVRRVGGSTIITTFAGTGVAGYGGDGGAATLAQLNGPWGIAVDTASGIVYVADQDSNRVRAVATNGVITTVVGTGVAGFSGDNGQAVDAQIYGPCGLAVGGGVLYVADYWNSRIRSVSLTTGVILTFAGSGCGYGCTGYAGDGGLAVTASLYQPAGVAVDEAGDVWIADTSNNVVRVVSAATGVIFTVAGQGPAHPGYNGDGRVSTTAELNKPYAVSTGTGSAVWVADSDNFRVRMLTPVSPSPSPTALPALQVSATVGGFPCQFMRAHHGAFNVWLAQFSAGLAGEGAGVGGSMPVQLLLVNNVAAVAHLHGFTSYSTAFTCDGEAISVGSAGNSWVTQHNSTYTTNTDDVTSSEDVRPTPKPSGGSSRMPAPPRRLSVSNTGKLVVLISFRYRTLALATAATTSAHAASVQARVTAALARIAATDYAPWWTDKNKAAVDSAVVVGVSPPPAPAPSNTQLLWLLLLLVLIPLVPALACLYGYAGRHRAVSKDDDAPPPAHKGEEAAPAAPPAVV